MRKEVSLDSRRRAIPRYWYGTARSTGQPLYREPQTDRRWASQRLRPPGPRENHRRLRNHKRRQHDPARARIAHRPETTGDRKTSVRNLCGRGVHRLPPWLARETRGDSNRVGWLVTDEHTYSGSGRIIAVNNLASALVAVEEIVEQGEGAGHVQVWDGDSDVFHPKRDQVAHYYRFQELKLGRRYRRGDTPRTGPTGDPISIDWDSVRPMRTNPRMCDHVQGSPIRVAQEKFNQSYYALLQLLEEAFGGAPRTLGSLIGAMYSLKAQAQALVQMPTEDGLATAGPTFEYVAPDHRAGSP